MPPPPQVVHLPLQRRRRAHRPEPAEVSQRDNLHKFIFKEHRLLPDIRMDKRFSEQLIFQLHYELTGVFPDWFST